MRGYEFINRTRVEYGEGALDKLKDFVKEYDFTNVMIITGPVLERLGAADKVRELLEEGGSRARVVYSDVPRDGSIETVKEIVSQILVNNINGIVAIGGGSVLDTAKAVKYMCCDSSDINTFIEGADAIRRPLSAYVPLICIPTTCGTGSEVTSVAVLKARNGVKSEVMSHELLPDACVLMPGVMETLPNKSAFFTAVDALAHAVEALTSLEKNPISDAFALSAIDVIGANIDLAAHGDTGAKYKLLLAANHAGRAFSNAMVGLAHALAHALGSLLSIPHDIACALTLPETMRFNLARYGGEYVKAAAAFGIENASAEGFIDLIERKISDYCREFKVEAALKSYMRPEVTIERMINAAYRDGARATNGRYATRGDIADILHRMLKRG